MTTTCEPCDNYLEKRHKALLPLIGQEVTKTGQTPDRVITRILAKYHRLGHPTPSTPPPPPTEATKALRRIASRKKPA